MKKNRLAVFLAVSILLGSVPGGVAAAEPAAVQTVIEEAGPAADIEAAEVPLFASYRDKLVRVKVKGSSPVEYDYYYYDKNGKKLKNAWKTIKRGGKSYRYYFGADGRAYRASADPAFKYNVTVRKIGGVKYGFNTTGLMVTGIAVTANLDGGTLYYFGSNGKFSEAITKQLRQAAKRGSSSAKLRSLLKKYEGKEQSSYTSNVCSIYNGVQPLRANVSRYHRFEVQYYEMPGGKEIVYLVIGALKLDAAEPELNSGTVFTGWKTVNGKTYYYNKGGKKTTGVHKILGKTYVFTAKGVLVKNKKVYKAGDGYYKITAAGVATQFTGVQELAAKRLLSSTVNMNLKRAFQWSSMKFFSVPAPSATTESKIAEYYGKFGFTNHRGNCYVQAYTFYWMAKLLGQKVKVVRGYVKKSSGLSSHAWCEITNSKGALRIYDPNFNSEYKAKLNNPDAGWNFVYGAKNTLRYYNAKKKPM